MAKRRFYHADSADETGTQIDLVIDRSDHVINLCEIKFYNQIFILSKEYAPQLRQNAEVFRRVTKTKEQLFHLLITTFALKAN